MSPLDNLFRIRESMCKRAYLAKLWQRRQNSESASQQVMENRQDGPNESEFLGGKNNNLPVENRKFSRGVGRAPSGQTTEDRRQTTED